SKTAVIAKEPAAWRGHADAGTVVGVVRAFAGQSVRADHDDVVAIGRREIRRVLVAVAGRHDHRGATRDGAVDRLLQVGRALRRSAQTEIQDLRGRRIVRYALDA